MKGQATLKQIQLISIFDQDDLSVKIDRMRSLQILLNLISNSLKFSKEGEFVGISCDYKNDPGDSCYYVVSFKVVDNGIGISEADLPNIFKPFFKTSDATSR
jgi:signal transduction histidine kinase